MKLALPPPPPPQAVCCSDGNHCCPTDYTCDVEKTTCTKGEVVIPWYTKLPASASVEDDPASVQCDGQEQCPDDNTCCQLQSGEWGCCPMPDVSAETRHKGLIQIIKMNTTGVTSTDLVRACVCVCRPCAARIRCTAARRATPATWPPTPARSSSCCSCKPSR